MKVAASYSNDFVIIGLCNILSLEYHKLYCNLFKEAEGRSELTIMIT